MSNVIPRRPGMTYVGDQTSQNYGITLMRVLGDKNQLSEDVFDFMISYLPFPQKSIRSELAKLFFHQYISNYQNTDCGIVSPCKLTFFPSFNKRLTFNIEST